MNIRKLQKKIVRLDRKIGKVLKTTGHHLELVEYDPKNDGPLYQVLHDVVGHLDYIHYKLRRAKTFYKSRSIPSDISCSMCKRYSFCLSLLFSKMPRIRSWSGILSFCSYNKNVRGIRSASDKLRKFSRDMVLFPASTRFMESSDNSARSASSACVKFSFLRYNLTLSAMMYLISFILLFSILCIFEMKNKPVGTDI